MSVSREEIASVSLQSVPRPSVVHESVIGIKATVKRFPTMEVPGVTELSRVASYQRRSVESVFAFPRSVASLLRGVCERSVASASVAGVRAKSLETCVSEYRVPLRPVASALQTSPKVALAPALQALRRAALAKKCQRIAGRLAQLEEVRPRRQLQ